MTRTLLLGAGSLWLVLLAGCYSGPLGPRTSYTSAPPTQTGSPGNRPPVANQPGIGSGTASSVRVVPFAAISKNAMVQVQNGTAVRNGSAVRGGTQPLALLASNGQMIDGRSLTVNEAKPKEDRPRGGGGGGGGGGGYGGGGGGGGGGRRY